MASKKKAKKTTSTSKRLLRSKSDKMVTGVIGGIAQYIGVDSTLLRLAWLLVVAFTGFIPGIIAYGLASVVIPEK